MYACRYVILTLGPHKTYVLCCPQLTFKYTLTHYLSKNSKGFALAGTNTLDDNMKCNNTTTTILKVCIPCLSHIIFV